MGPHHTTTKIFLKGVRFRERETTPSAHPSKPFVSTRAFSNGFTVGEKRKVWKKSSTNRSISRRKSTKMTSTIVRVDQILKAETLKRFPETVARVTTSWTRSSTSASTSRGSCLTFRRRGSMTTGCRSRRTTRPTLSACSTGRASGQKTCPSMATRRSKRALYCRNSK